MKVQINFGHEKWCTECKTKIREGEKYAVIKEEVYGNEFVEKDYHLSCIPVSEDCDEDIDLGSECDCNPYQDFTQDNQEDYGDI